MKQSIIAFFEKTTVPAVVFLFVLTSFFTHSSARAEQAPFTKGSNVFLTLADEHGIPNDQGVEEFDCSDKIYTVVELQNYRKGRHELSVRWIDPNDTTRENTQYPFHVLQEEVKLWAWLSLSRARGAGMLQWLNPAAGLEEFIGPWKIEVRIDGDKIATKSFEVSC